MTAPATDGLRHRVEVAGPGSVVLRETPSEEPPPGRIRVDVEYCGVCSSDLHSVRDERTAPGTPLGHEAVGTVRDGRGLVPAGRYVVRTSEGFSNALLADPDDLVPLLPSLRPEHGALVEPVACALRAVERSIGRCPPERALVVGAGFMGVVVVRLLVARGLSVFVADPDESAQQRARDLGAEAAFTPDGADAAGDMPLVLECVGSQAALDLALRAVATRGVLSVVGYHQSGGGRRDLDMQALNYRGVDLINAHERDFAIVRGAMNRAMVLMSRGIVDVLPLLAAVTELTELPTVLTGRAMTGKRIARCSA